jgi:deazaflavin-dependent oxidoreductase (nitroreductase family)
MPSGDTHAEPKGSTCRLIHYGRKSGKPYSVKIWFVVLDGDVWIGSLDADRNWVRNVASSGKAELDFGSGPRPVRCEPVTKPVEIERFRAAVTSKYPIASRLIRLFVRGGRQCAFKTKAAATTT